MDHAKLLNKVDHTLLAQGATWEEIRQICDDAIRFKTASVCIPPSYVKQAKGYVGDRMKICTVIGFPNGYNTTAVKEFETRDAIANGADEIDMVIPVGFLKAGEYDAVYEDIKAVRDACAGKVLKVIFENCLLTDEEKIKACELSVKAGTDYVKTSTGFSTGGATISDVALMKAHVEGKCKVKAAGGIRDYNTAAAMIDAGADRLGTSATIKIMEGRQ